MIRPTGRTAVPDQLSVLVSIEFSHRNSDWNRVPRSSKHREIDAENHHGDRERRRKQRLRTGLRDLDNFIAIDRAARALKDGAASCDDGNSNHHHCKSGIAAAAATNVPALSARRWGGLPLPTTSTRTSSLTRKKPNAATARPVRIQARKVRSFAAWFV